MLRLAPALRAPVLCGLLAALCSDTVLASLHPRAPQATAPPTVTAVSNCHLHGTTQFCEAGTAEFQIVGTVTADSYTNCHGHGTNTHCDAPTGEVQILLASETNAPSPTPAAASSSLSAVSDCHLHGTEVVCMAGETEYLVHTTATATQDLPPAFTGCHTHGTDTMCLGPDGGDVEISLAAEEGDHGHEHDEHSEESSSGQNCHFHAGVEHCESHGAEGATQRSCSRVQRDYNIGLRVGLLFVMLATSSLGVFGPIFLSTIVSPQNVVFMILRQFGTGIIISTAFIHLFTHAQLMFQNECLGDLGYEGTAAALLMAGIFVSFLVEYAGQRLAKWQSNKAADGGAESAEAAAARSNMVNISVLEAGVIFHSLLIGLTLVVAGDTFFLTLFAVIVFHQMFEGIALGTRLAALGQPGVIVPHGHAHHHGHLNPSQDAPATQTVTSKERAGEASGDESASNVEGSTLTPGFSMRKKLLFALAFAVVTPIGMAIGIGVLQSFNGNDPSTVITIGTLDAVSAGILVWVGVVEMWSHDWMNGGEMTDASPLRTGLGLSALMLGMGLMSLLGKWA